MLLTAAVWPQFATQVFRRGIGRLTCIGSYVNRQVTTFTFRRRQQHVREIILGQLWMQVASVHHEYGRLTLATAGLLLHLGLSVVIFCARICSFVRSFTLLDLFFLSG